MTKSAEILNGKLFFFAVADDLDCDDDFPILHGMLNVFSCSIFLLVEILLKFLFDFLSTLACFQDIRVQNNSFFSCDTYSSLNLVLSVHLG